MSVKNLSISNLTFLICTGHKLQKEASKELARRFKHNTVSSIDFLLRDGSVIEKRGEFLGSYLIGANPDMDLLMKLYMTYPSSWLLQSELLLCNNFNTKTNFFTLICKLELLNINKRLQTTENRLPLLKAREILEKRVAMKDKGYFNEYTYGYYDGFNIFQVYLEKLDINDIDNITLLDKIKIIGVSSLRDILDNDFAADILAKRFILKEEKKLQFQKNTLLKQTKDGYKVNYSKIFDL